MNLKIEGFKKNVFLVLLVIFMILTFAGAIGVVTHKFDNAGYACIPMVFGIIFGMQYRNSKKAIEENRNKENSK